MKSRDIAIVGICLAVGAILRFIANMFPGAIVGNPIIALYCLSIILIMPKFKEAFGIGIVAALVSMLISHSIFPPANLISEPLGALTCAAIYGLIGEGKKFEKISLVSPAITTFIATLVSGFSFIAVCMIVMLGSFISVPGGTLIGFFSLVAPIVVFTAVFNCVVTQILYFPAKKIISR
ncbi:MAG: hypothetical protein PHP13_00225 [Methanomicrobium sp.]|nr:hypothetical protein [Methanomicrobium sp.]MDD4299831.1 hypothetical protein [Methanomicrobium sp.]